MPPKVAILHLSSNSLPLRFFALPRSTPHFFSRRRAAAAAAEIMVSYKWAYARIMSGTIIGGVLGFCVTHRLEKSYKEKMKERLIEYEKEMKLREQQRQDRSELLPDP